MAHLEKFNKSAVVNQLRHNNREIKNDSNREIDTGMSYLNEALIPDRGMRDYDYFKRRLSELYVFNRPDVKVMAGWVITLPQEIKDSEKERAFFEAAYNFVSKRYGPENIIQAVIHRDEGVLIPQKSRFGGVMTNSDGETIMKRVGQHHLHICFLPVVADNNPRHKQTEKICANERLNREELCSFHGDLQRYLDLQGIECSVRTGKTAKGGRNRTVEELKEREALLQEIERLNAEIERYQKHEHKHKNQRW